jgi:hypothetical protein
MNFFAMRKSSRSNECDIVRMFTDEAARARARCCRPRAPAIQDAPDQLAATNDLGLLVVAQFVRVIAEFNKLERAGEPEISPTQRLLPFREHYA